MPCDAATNGTLSTMASNPKEIPISKSFFNVMLKKSQGSLSIPNECNAETANDATKMAKMNTSKLMPRKTTPLSMLL